MTGKMLKSIILIKAVLLVVGGFVLNHSIRAQNATKSAEESASTAEKVKKSEEKGPIDYRLPEVPAGRLSIAQAQAIRTEMEMIRKDVEEKIERLKNAKTAYDKSRSDIETKLRRIEDERRLLEDTLQKEKVAKDDRVKETIDYLVKMEPRKAAPILEGMDRDLVIILLRKLPAKFVTKAFEAMNPKKATEYMEYYTRIRSGREFDLLQQLGLCQPSEQTEVERQPTSAQASAASASVPLAAPTPEAKETPSN